MCFHYIIIEQTSQFHVRINYWREKRNKAGCTVVLINFSWLWEAENGENKWSIRIRRGHNFGGICYSDPVISGNKAVLYAMQKLLSLNWSVETCNVMAVIYNHSALRLRLLNCLDVRGRITLDSWLTHQVKLNIFVYDDDDTNVSHSKQPKCPVQVKQSSQYQVGKNKKDVTLFLVSAYQNCNTVYIGLWQKRYHGCSLPLIRAFTGVGRSKEKWLPLFSSIKTEESTKQGF